MTNAIDTYINAPRSELTSIQERAYRDTSSPREFGERNHFTQRLSGFFVPPVTSLYTFAIFADDASRFFISPSLSPEEKEFVAFSDQHTRNQWNFFESQTTTPRMMEQGRYYYIEAYSNNYGGERGREGGRREGEREGGREGGKEGERERQRQRQREIERGGDGFEMLGVRKGEEEEVRDIRIENAHTHIHTHTQ